MSYRIASYSGSSRSSPSTRFFTAFSLCNCSSRSLSRATFSLDWWTVMAISLPVFIFYFSTSAFFWSASYLLDDTLKASKALAWSRRSSLLRFRGRTSMLSISLAFMELSTFVRATLWFSIFEFSETQLFFLMLEICDYFICSSLISRCSLGNSIGFSWTMLFIIYSYSGFILLTGKDSRALPPLFLLISESKRAISLSLEIKANFSFLI